jgi:hypothetical protein
VWGWATAWFEAPPDTSDIPADPVPPLAEVAAVAYDYLLNHVNQQSQDYDSRDVKLGILFASGTGIVGVLAAALAIRPLPHGAGLVLMVLVSIPYIAVAAFSVLGLRRSWFRVGPPVSEIRSLARQETGAIALYATLLPHLERACNANETVLYRIYRAILYAYWALVIQVVIFFGCIYWVVLHA